MPINAPQILKILPSAVHHHISLPEGLFVGSNLEVESLSLLLVLCVGAVQGNLRTQSVCNCQWKVC